MSNSNLVNYTKISPYKSSPRTDDIKKITIHHMAGKLSVETCGNVFQSSNSSANYGVDGSGNVGMYVEECDRSWASSSRENDHQAVTIEVANCETSSPWAVSDTALEKTIDLCVDICERNGIEKLIYTGDETGDLTRHNMFANTACPGPYLQSKFDYIADSVNARLNGEEVATTDSTELTVSEIAIDGRWGQATTKALQTKLGTTVDGIISNQSTVSKKLHTECSDTSWQWNDNDNGSNCIKALQKMLGGLDVDGKCGSLTIKALQKHLETDITGYIDTNTVMSLQNFINN